MIVKVGKYRVELWDDLSEMPATRMQEFNVAVLVDANVGGDLEAIDQHLQRLLKLVKLDDKEKLTNEVMAMRQSMFFVIQKVSPRHKAFVSLIKSINGKPLDSLSEDTIKQVIEKLSDEGLTEGKIKQVVSEVKKKFRQLLSYFSLRSRQQRESSKP